MPDQKEEAVARLLVAPGRDSLSKEQFAARVPRRSHPDDAGLDLVVDEYMRVEARCKATVPHGIRVVMPPECFGQLVPRSSTLLLKGLIMQVGTIDPGYRGVLATVVYNPNGHAVILSEGDRISQLLILPFKPFPVATIAVANLPKTERGEAGFGSTGGMTQATR